jgi:hypothetical protein
LEGTLTDDSAATAAGTLGHGIVLAVDIVLWAGLAGLAVFGLSGLLLTRRPTLSPVILGLFALLTLLAAWVQFAQHEWARTRFRVYDPEYVGLAASVPPALVFWAVASLAVGIAFSLLGRQRRGDI